LRKILFAAFKKNLNKEIKVAQFSGYVSEHSAYHHGEQSLNGAIVGMAQNFVGSNNINLFEPCGQFGTRLQGGKDSASERYIFTHLNSITRMIFQETDDKVLKYLSDDGVSVEPIHYVPIIPMILVNGSKGIGTGFSTDIMCYNVLDIINYIKNKLNGNEDTIKIRPYYEGFNGIISIINENKYLIKGCYEVLDANSIRVTELPIGFWTDDFKEHLEELINMANAKPEKVEKGKDGEKKGKKIKKNAGMIKDYKDLSTDVTIDVTITFNAGAIQELVSQTDEYGCNALEKLLKLYTTQTTTNIHAFDAKEKLKKYESAEEIIEDYYPVRYGFYEIRKQNMIDSMTKELLLLGNKARYIQELIDDTLDLRKKKKDEIIKILEDKGYDKIDDDNDYKYLVKMPMDSVSEENVARIMNDRDSKTQALEILMSKNVNQLWLEELDNLTEEYISLKTEKMPVIKIVDKGIKKKVKKSKKQI
jgi:DNA topoisomerase-2